MIKDVTKAVSSIGQFYSCTMSLKRRIPRSSLSQFLNEKIPGLPYECLGQFGHVHQPCFRMVVVFNGNVYQGEGSSKKSAKIDAAQNACNDWFKVGETGRDKN